MFVSRVYKSFPHYTHPRLLSGLFCPFSRTTSLKKHFSQRLNLLWGVKLTDIQYSKIIDDDIETMDINSAYFALLQSHFHQVVLDIGVFERVFSLLKESPLHLSYSVVLYKLYRQCFSPSINIFPHMLRMENTEIKDLIFQDMLELRLRINTIAPKGLIERQQGRNVKHGFKEEANFSDPSKVSCKRVKIYGDSESPIEYMRPISLGQLGTAVTNLAPSKVSIGEIDFRLKKE